MGRVREYSLGSLLACSCPVKPSRKSSEMIICEWHNHSEGKIVQSLGVMRTYG